MISENNLRRCYLALAFAMPLVFFINLPFNAENAIPEAMDRFFGADCWRVQENLRDTESVPHYRDKVHPYFSLFAVSVAKLASVTGISGAEFLWYRMVFGTTGVFLFWMLIYRETKNPLIAFSATLLLLSTFTVKVWSTLPDTFIFGFFTLMLSLNLIRMRSGGASVFVISFSGATTNGFLGALYLFIKARSGKSISRDILCISASIAILSILQKTIYPSSSHFFDVAQISEERLYINKSLASIPLRVFDFIYSGFVIPLPENAGAKVMSDQLWIEFFGSMAAGYSQSIVVGVLLVLIAVPLLVGISLYLFANDPGRSELSKITLTFLAFQAVLHMVYGDMPFLYSYHFLPMIVLFICLQLPKGGITAAALLGLSAVLHMIGMGQLDRFERIFG